MADYVDLFDPAADVIEEYERAGLYHPIVTGEWVGKAQVLNGNLFSR